ncbi:MAG: pilus assembly protein PilP [Rickettsiales bacterium]|nr:pilus assembly protein PilP [Rickettsiales bacterium]
MKNFSKFFLVVIILGLGFQVVAENKFKLVDAKNISNVRDPFSPTSGNIISSKSLEDSSDAESFAKSSNPLTASKLNTFKVVGVIISEKGKVAGVKAVNGLDYVVSAGDYIGSEGGKVSEITFEGVTISSSEGKVFIPVSNKLEVKLDKKSE